MYDQIICKVIKPGNNTPARWQDLHTQLTCNDFDQRHFQRRRMLAGVVPVVPISSPGPELMA